MRISEATIRKITENADIVAIIGEHIKLERKGNDYKGFALFIMIRILLYPFPQAKKYLNVLVAELLEMQ